MLHRYLFAMGLTVGCVGETTDGDTGTNDPFAVYAHADFSDADVVVDLATNLSAPSAYVFSVLFVALLEKKGGDCPVRTEEGAVTTWDVRPAKGDPSRRLRSFENYALRLVNGGEF